eukprot:g2338.t1
MDELCRTVARKCYWTHTEESNDEGGGEGKADEVQALTVLEPIKQLVLRLKREARNKRAIATQPVFARLLRLIQKKKVDPIATAGVINFRFMAKHDMMPAIPTTLGRAVEETRTREVRLQGLLAIAEIMAAFGEAGVWYGARDPSIAAANRIVERLSGIFRYHDIYRYKGHHNRRWRTMIVLPQGGLVRADVVEGLLRRGMAPQDAARLCEHSWNAEPQRRSLTLPEPITRSVEATGVAFIVWQSHNTRVATEQRLMAGLHDLRTRCRDNLREGGRGLMMSYSGTKYHLGMPTAIADYTSSTLEEALAPIRIIEDWVLKPMQDEQMELAVGSAPPRNERLYQTRPTHEDPADATPVLGSMAAIAGLTSFLEQQVSPADAQADAQQLTTAVAEMVRRTIEAYTKAQDNALRRWGGAEPAKTRRELKYVHLLVASSAVRKACRIRCNGVCCAADPLTEQVGGLVYCQALMGVYCKACRAAQATSRMLRSVLSVLTHYPEVDKADALRWPLPAIYEHARNSRT